MPIANNTLRRPARRLAAAQAAPAELRWRLRCKQIARCAPPQSVQLLAWGGRLAHPLVLVLRKRLTQHTTVTRHRRRQRTRDFAEAARAHACIAPPTNLLPTLLLLAGWLLQLSPCMRVALAHTRGVDGCLAASAARVQRAMWRLCPAAVLLYHACTARRSLQQGARLFGESAAHLASPSWLALPPSWLALPAGPCLCKLAHPRSCGLLPRHRPSHVSARNAWQQLSPHELPQHTPVRAHGRSLKSQQARSSMAARSSCPGHNPVYVLPRLVVVSTSASIASTQRL